MNGINNIQAEGQLYDILAPEVVNDYVEKLGKPCANPNGYTTGSLILATDGGNVQRLYKVTQPITSSQNIVEDGNVVRKKLGDLFDDLEVELNGEIDDVDTELGNVKNALSNEVTTRTKVSTHNLLRTRDDNDTWRGVTFTKNSDKTFTLSGQITTSPSIWECANITGAELELLKGAPLIISGSISNTSRMTIAAKDASGTYVLDENVYTDEKTITIPNSAVELSVYFVVNETAGTTVSGTYKPMLRWATDSNSEYSPYVPTNSQLLSYKDNGVLGAKNFYDNNVDYTPSNSTLTLQLGRLIFLVLM